MKCNALNQALRQVHSEDPPMKCENHKSVEGWPVVQPKEMPLRCHSKGVHGLILKRYTGPTEN